MKTQILTPESIINRLYEIQDWINKNGFSNRGRHSAGDSAKELQKALETVLTASKTLYDHECAYMYLYLEKTIKEHPDFAKKWEKAWYPISMGWIREGQDLQYLYNRAIEYNTTHSMM